MSEHEWATPDEVMRVRLSDFNSIPSHYPSWGETLNGNGSHSTNTETVVEGVIAPKMTVVTIEQFATATDDVAPPLLGTLDASLLPSNGMLLMYGDGGAGKTTLTVDAMAHLASGTPWVGIPVPAPITVMVIENEGPRGPFRRRLAAKIASWQGRTFLERVHVMEDPWTLFTLTDRHYRAQLGEWIDKLAIDLVMVGPMASIGARGTGTPDDVNEFHSLVTDLRACADRHFGLWIVHHENKAGDVSGAWQRYPDTLVHVQAQGNGRTRIVWRKARWSSEHHGNGINLAWAEGSGFRCEEDTARDYKTQIITAMQNADPQWYTIAEILKLVGGAKDKVTTAAQEMVEAGDLVFEKGPPGRSAIARCYTLSNWTTASVQFRPVDAPMGSASELDDPPYPFRDGVGQSSSSQEPFGLDESGRPVDPESFI